MSALPLYRKALDWERFFDEYPLPDDFESTKTYAAGLVIRDLSAIVSSWQDDFTINYTPLR